jgi:FkbM family methyltransferase
MKYDFIEIGTSDFDTLIQTATNTTRGISIEPIQYYLDRLPNPANVVKLCCAVSPNNQTAMLEIYYVPDNVIQAQGLPNWLRGCNSIGAYHLQHKKLGIQHLVKITHVPCYPLEKILTQYQVTELDLLKIDTEGRDCDILLNLFGYLKSCPTTAYPKQILFESNELADPTQVELVKSRFLDIGYRVIHAGSDTVLEFS